MSADVPTRRTIARQADVVSGRAVRSRTWLTAAALANWSGGKGEALVPAYDPGQTIAAAATKIFVWKVLPNGRSVRRTWNLCFVGAATVKITIGAGATVERSTTAAGTWITLNEDLAAKSAALTDLTLTVENQASSATVMVASIACHEAPRAVLLQDAADYGVDTVSLQAREPIGSRSYASLGGIAASLALATQRRHYIAHARPANATDAWSTTSGSYVAILLDAVLVARKVYAGATTGDVRWYFYVSTTAGTTGTIRVTHPDASTTTAAIPDSASWSWVTVDSTAKFACEDLTTSDGLVAGTFPEFDVHFLRASGAGSVYVAAVCGHEI